MRLSDQHFIGVFNTMLSNQTIFSHNCIEFFDLSGIATSSITNNGVKSPDQILVIDQLLNLASVHVYMTF